MIVKCPQCETRFDVPDTQIKSEGIKVRCGKCSKVFGVRPPRAAMSPTPPPVISRDQPSVDPDSSEWFSDSAVSSPEAAIDRLAIDSMELVDPLADLMSTPSESEPASTLAGPSDDFGELGLQHLLEPDEGHSPLDLPQDMDSPDYRDFPAPVSDGFKAVKDQKPERLASWLATILAVIVVVVAFLGFVAWRNEGLLDLRDLDQMVGVAFKGGSYQPRSYRVIRVYEVEGAIVEEELEGEGEFQLDQPLRIQNLRQSVYVNSAGVRLVLVEGELFNTSDEPHRRVFVGGRLSRGGERLATARVPVGASLDQERLEGIFDAAALANLYDDLAEQVSGLVIHPNVLTRFSLVFLDGDGRASGSGVSYRVRVLESEWADMDGLWRHAVSNQDLFEPLGS